jgi:hypothetical protein
MIGFMTSRRGTMVELSDFQKRFMAIAMLGIEEKNA